MGDNHKNKKVSVVSNPAHTLETEVLERVLKDLRERVGKELNLAADDILITDMNSRLYHVLYKHAVELNGFKAKIPMRNFLPGLMPVLCPQRNQALQTLDSQRVKLHPAAYAELHRYLVESVGLPLTPQIIALFTTDCDYYWAEPTDWVLMAESGKQVIAFDLKYEAVEPRHILNLTEANGAVEPTKE